MAPIRILLVLCSIAFISCNTSKRNTLGFDPFSYKIQKKVISENGAVVSAHPLASKVGIEILKKGGNAMDAAIATQLALAVVYPNAGNIGGGGFTIAHLSDGRLLAIDYREKAPGKAHRDMYLDSAGNALTQKSQHGHLSSGVPGAVAGIFECLPYAKLTIKDLITPAIALAEKGFRITAREASALNRIQSRLKNYNTVTPVFVKERQWQEGDTLVQTDLANTLKRIRDEGMKGFYEGETAKLIVEEMQRGGGIITLEDLKNYKAVSRKPHQFSYKGYSIVSMPMPSSGGVLINQLLKMTESRPLQSYGYQSPKAVQLMVEAERRAYADRAEYMGDLDFYKVEIDKIVTESYLAERMKDYDSTIAGNSQAIKPGQIQKESEETTHFSVIDKEGNAVSVTTTLNNSYGSGTVVGGAGFFMNDEMDDFSIKPGVPNMYGALGGEANAIEPGKRMLSAMTPTIVLKDGTPFLVLGTPGGTTIPTSVFQTIVNIIDFGLSTEDAVNRPKFHHQWFPDSVFIEKGFPESTRMELEKMGYKFKVRESIGRTEVIKVLPGKKFEAIADNRGDDSAEGY